MGRVQPLLGLLQSEDQIIAGWIGFVCGRKYKGVTLTTVFLVLPRVGYCKKEGT